MPEHEPTYELDDAMTRRMKALACTAPLHDLDARKGMLDWVDAGVYQMAEIALHMIDKVTIAMDFDSGADHERMINKVTPFVAAQAPGRPNTEHARVAGWVLDNLLNVGTVDRGFRRVYGELDEGGTYRRRAFDFKLLVERAGTDGQVYLRATDEAINVLVGALDTDVESAQVAAELKLEHLISSGRLAEAKLAAEQARYRTVQFGETLRGRLDATRRDVRAVDWEREIPELLDSALRHVEARFRAESAILRDITAARDDTEDGEQKRRAAELVDIVGDCIRRHTQLQARLQSAGAVFRAEQDRQQFSGPAKRAAIDLYGQLLTPILEQPVGTAARPLEAYFRAAAGIRPPTATSLPSLVSLLLRPAPERAKVVGEIPEPQLAPSEDSERFSEEHWRMADELLDLPEVGRELSGLLAEAAERDPDLARLVALRAVHAYSPEVGAAVRSGQGRMLVAVATDRTIETEVYGGDELLLTSAEISSETGTAEDGTAAPADDGASQEEVLR